MNTQFHRACAGTTASALTPGSEEQILCTAVITMAHNLGLQVVAEGVETAAQAALLKELGCDLAQGYYFAPAISAAEFRQLLLQQQAQG